MYIASIASIARFFQPFNSEQIKHFTTDRFRKKAKKKMRTSRKSDAATTLRD